MSLDTRLKEFFEDAMGDGYPTISDKYSTIGLMSNVLAMGAPLVNQQNDVWTML